jgi:hypothetical protein
MEVKRIKIPQTGDELIIETDLTAEERAACIEGERHYREHPEDFFTLDYVLAHEDEFRPKKAARARFRKPAEKAAGRLTRAGRVRQASVSGGLWPAWTGQAGE